ncbi:protein of unknown function [Pseudidiomarina planktonica]|uniref:DUF4826 domain-containing protein n=1 Tax=Pseudidiomarina planktonica TaxID=1323738 RepID=A0A1Y6EX67_9GAMM|nr:DUF4826 family protein [Pseudidiomarina planktonica]RUO65310.1 DUF4826 domain-containing protein [Pseudidiomarina planktonica]SMQ65550.1 protein of unknown function [Pseudidiomarina planktonica]
MTTEAQQQLTPEQNSEWVRERFQAGNKYLAEQGILTKRVLVKDSRYVAPLVAMWKFEANDGKHWWVVTGDLPTDHVSGKAAKDAREAMRHFALSWQMRAESIFQDKNAANDATQQAFAHRLVNRSEGLYDISNDEKLWQTDPNV